MLIFFEIFSPIISIYFLQSLLKNSFIYNKFNKLLEFFSSKTSTSSSGVDSLYLVTTGVAFYMVSTNNFKSSGSILEVRTYNKNKNTVIGEAFGFSLLNSNSCFAYQYYVYPHPLT